MAVYLNANICYADLTFLAPIRAFYSSSCRTTILVIFLVKLKALFTLLSTMQYWARVHLVIFFLEYQTLPSRALICALCYHHCIWQKCIAHSIMWTVRNALNYVNESHCKNFYNTFKFNGHILNLKFCINIHFMKWFTEMQINPLP